MALKDGDASGLPAWARRIRAERAARGWSQQQAVEALRAHAGEDARLAEKASLLRNWKRWEAGSTEPDAFHKPLRAETFGTVTAALFPAPRPEYPVLLGNTGVDTLEIISRLQVSDVSPAVLDGIHVAVEQLNNDYSHVEAEEVIRSGTTPDGVIRRPMRVAGAHITLGIVAAREGDLETALGQGRAALASDRQALPSLAMHSRELAAALQGRYPDDPRVRGYVAELKSIIY